MPDADTLIDWEQARAAMGGDAQLLHSVIEAFLEEAPRLLETLRRGLAERDAVTMLRAAHTLKSTLSYFGNPPAADLAMQLEVLGRRNSFAEAPSLLAELDAQLARVLACLTAHLGTQAA